MHQQNPSITSEYLNTFITFSAGYDRSLSGGAGGAFFINLIEFFK